ncbi:MAG: hypothetical protein ACRC3Y_18110 [Romboutsia sp.]|uniref:ParM/StbA family protein n=1 Tax=Romboutsia sp. TaxID=1965302 RepID=UPI003F3CC3AA
MERKVVKAENVMDDTIVTGNDIGFGQVKSAFMMNGKVEEIIYKSNVSEGEGLLTSESLIIDGNKYIFSDEAEEIISLGTTTKDTDMHRILLARSMYLIAKKIGNTKLNFKMMVTSPLYSYKTDKGEKQLNKLLGKKKSFVIDDGTNKYTLSISEMQMIPESVAACFVLPTKIVNIKEDKIILCDIGNLNIGLIGIDGKPDIANSTGLTIGVHHIIGRLVELAKANPHWNIITRRDMLRYLKNADDKDINIEVQKILNTDVFESLDGLMKELGSEVRGCKIVFLGGGSILFEQFIRNRFVDEKSTKNIAFVQNSSTISARGALAKALKIYKL